MTMQEADCVCLYLMPACPLFKTGPKMLRTGPVSFAVASSLANRLQKTCQTWVVPASRYVLDRYPQAPLLGLAVQYLLGKPVRRLRLFPRLLRGVYLN